MQNHHFQPHQHQTHRASVQSSVGVATKNFTNTAKLPIETVKLLIASVSHRPNLWIRTGNGQKRAEINALWQQVGQEVHLPADICRIKWGHLRDNFRKVLIRNTLSSEAPTTWRFYNDMRFMEAAVAENVMRHNRLREQSIYWQGLDQRVNPRQNSSTSSTGAINETCNAVVQNQFNFSELSAFFQNHSHKDIDYNNSTNKRIKLENTESENSSKPPAKCLFSSDNDFQQSVNNLHVANDSIETHDIDHNDDDAQFDEDDVSLEDKHETFVKDDRSSNCHLPKKYFETENTCLHNDERDSDRLFLLSLLPYLRKVQEHRKLQVRQKLQDVLIQEFG